MNKCDKCKKSLSVKESMEYNSLSLCEDCYIDFHMPQNKKPYYENDDSKFMRRLQDNHTIHKQRYH